jgi:hypothetical protein
LAQFFKWAASSYKPWSGRRSYVVDTTNPRRIEMLDHEHRRRPAPSALSTVAEHPGKMVLRLLPMGIGIMLVVDLALGATAEYFNAVHLVHAWATLISGGSVSSVPAFLAGQTSLGAPVAMSLGTALLFLEPAAFLALVVYPISFFAKRFSA